MASHDGAQKRISILIIITSFSAFIVLSVGVFSPAWIIVEQNGMRVSEGPWYTRACPLEGGDCILSTRELIYDMHSNGRDRRRHSGLRKENWSAIRSETTTAVVLAFLSWTLAVIAYRRRKWMYVQWPQITGVFCSFVSSCLALVAILTVTTAEERPNAEQPWSRDSTIIGAVLAFLTCAKYVIVITLGRYIRYKQKKLNSDGLSTRNTSDQDLQRGQGQHIDFVPLDVLQFSAHLCHLHGQSSNTNYACGAVSETYPVNPPAYSAVCGDNKTDGT